MEIRYLNANDSLSDISSIYERSWKYAYQGIIPDTYLDSIPEGSWAGGIHKEGMHTLVLTHNGQLAGTASFCQSRLTALSGFGEIVSIYLLPEYIGKGYGKQLLNRCIRELNRLGFTELVLWVLEENQRARIFYEREGFFCTDAYRLDTFGGKELAEVLYSMRCDTPPAAIPGGTS